MKLLDYLINKNNTINNFNKKKQEELEKINKEITELNKKIFIFKEKYLNIFEFSRFFLSRKIYQLSTDRKIFKKIKNIVVIMFCENRKLRIMIREIEQGFFKYLEGTYIVDKNDAFFLGNIAILFYVENIPNPLKFNFRKYINEFITKKSQNIDDNSTIDFDGQLVDVSFSSINLSNYKDKKIIDVLLQDAQKSIHELIRNILIFAGVVVLVFFILLVRK